MDILEQLNSVMGMGEVDYGAMNEVPGRTLINEPARVMINFDNGSELEGMEFVFSQVEVFEHVDFDGTHDVPQRYITIQGHLG